MPIGKLVMGTLIAIAMCFNYHPLATSLHYPEGEIFFPGEIVSETPEKLLLHPHKNF